MERRELLKLVGVTTVGVTVAAHLPTGLGQALAQEKRWTIGFSQATTIEPWRAQFKKDILA